jgi:hypothetical protein
MFLKLYSWAIIVSILNGTLSISDKTTSHKTTVVGIALNMKGGAIVETDLGNYLLEGLDRWNDKYYGKKVKVTGKLVVKIHKKQSTDSIQVQERVGTLRILKRPKWKLFEE